MWLSLYGWPLRVALAAKAWVGTLADVYKHKKVIMRKYLKLVALAGFLLTGVAPLGGSPSAAQESTAQVTSTEVATSNATAAPSKTVAGKTVQQYADLLDETSRVVRLRAIKSLGAFGESAGPVLKSALGHSDRAVAYTAAVHLGRIGGEPLAAAIDPLTQLAENEDSLSLRLAGSFALCRAGQIDERLSVLTDALTYPERGMACSAAELIGMLGSDAKAAIETLEEVAANNDAIKRNGDYHVGGAAKNALRKIRGE